MVGDRQRSGRCEALLVAEEGGDVAEDDAGPGEVRDRADRCSEIEVGSIGGCLRPGVWRSGEALVVVLLRRR